MKYTLCNRLRALKVLGCMALLFLASSTLRAQVTVEATIDSLQLLIGEQAKVKLEVSMDANHKLILPAVRDTLDSLTVTAWGTDSIIINDQKDVMDLTLPLRYAVDSTVLVFRYSRHTTDTLVVRHVNTPYFVSMDCGYQMQQQITDIACTRHRLDSIYITYNEAGIYGQENVQLFY